MAMIGIVYAEDTEPFISYIDIPTGSTLTGSTRKYKSSNNRITITPTYLGCANGEITCPNRLVVQLEKKNLIGYSTKGTKTTYFYSYDLNTTRTLSYTSVGSGKFRYVFNTGNATHPYGSIYATPVIMYSYN